MIDQNPPQNDPNLYFTVQADFGITKHMGGRKATQEMLELCQVREGQSILEIGCGIGYTACYIAEEIGCRVTGVDINPKMVERSTDRARKHKVEDWVEFRLADAQELPFEAATFDAVIDESVTAFVPDKQKALLECARVVKLGGFVGLNEVTWVKTPSPELAGYASFIMAGAQFMPSESWRELLVGANLGDIQVKNYKFEAISQFREELRQLDLGEYTRAWYRFITQSFKNPAYRQFMKDIFSSPESIFKFIQHIGFGIFTGERFV